MNARRASSLLARVGRVRRIGLWLGPAMAMGMGLVPPPAGLDAVGWRTAAVATLMAVWWLTEAIPISATALVPLVLFPPLGVLSASAAAAPYAQELIFLFMGGFLIAAAMERWGLHRRIALAVMSRAGNSPGRLILGFMLATAFLSMWISNTATAAMMLPVAIAVAETLRPSDPHGRFGFGLALMLGVAYSASIGGMATLIGTPPNAVFAAAMAELRGVEIGFGRWMMVGLPVSLVMLPIAWFLLTRVLYRLGDLSGDAAAVIRAERLALGPASRGEWVVGVVFVLTASAWLLRAPKSLGFIDLPGIQTWAPGVRDSTIAMAGALVLFLIPVDRKRGRRALDWETARGIPWGVLVLFGGGLSLAHAMDVSGLAVWIGNGVTGLASIPGLIVLAVVATLFIFLTEVTSNTATATMAMPIMAGIAIPLGLPPETLMATAALACSMAFMLPVATPPNAIVFSSGYVSIAEMSRAGLLLNLIGIGLITLIAGLLIPAVLVR
ncbi:MAG TPA: SLC13/DASS family transporter [Deltaproteobacteria bacterium]|nr:SLC13/DASS family transporter [Deltaproteobacteria bacterium]